VAGTVRQAIGWARVAVFGLDAVVDLTIEVIVKPIAGLWLRYAERDALVHPAVAVIVEVIAGLVQGAGKTLTPTIGSAICIAGPGA
jgi:hypothetical protein